MVVTIQDVEIRTVRQSPATEGRIFMNKRITEAFANGKAFIPFLTCGDPSLEVTEQLVYAMEEAGADLIELGSVLRSYRRGTCDPGSQCPGICRRRDYR